MWTHLHTRCCILGLKIYSVLLARGTGGKGDQCVGSLYKNFTFCTYNLSCIRGTVRPQKEASLAWYMIGTCHTVSPSQAQPG
jgi:hypothetical protein